MARAVALLSPRPTYCQNVVMAFVIIQALKITGLLDWVGAYL